MSQDVATGSRSVSPRRPGSRRGSTWGVPAGLIVLTAFPLVAGTMRIVEIAGGPSMLPPNPRIDSSPWPLIVHVAAAAVLAVAGAFQFPARIRRRHRTWHRRSGRVLVGAGMLVAGSGAWMTIFYPGAPGGDLLWSVRLVVSSAMAACLVLGFTAIRRRDIAAHRAWMIRAFALAVAAGTQMFTQGIGEGVFGTASLVTALSVSAGWVVNAAIAEAVVRRPVRTARRTAQARGVV